MKYLSYLIIITVFVQSCTFHRDHKKELSNHIDNSKEVDKSQSSLTDSLLKDFVLDKIGNLPEVKAKQKFADSITNTKRSITILIAKTPSEAEPYYWVQVGYDNTIRFQPFYNFYIYKKDLSIKYFDPLTNKTMSLKEWRKNK